MDEVFNRVGGAGELNVVGNGSNLDLLIDLVVQVRGVSGIGQPGAPR
ncbi:MAG: hypothetical protein ACKODX_18145 [Gemmata sp.]